MELPSTASVWTKTALADGDAEAGPGISVPAATATPANPARRAVIPMTLLRWMIRHPRSCRIAGEPYAASGVRKLYRAQQPFEVGRARPAGAQVNRDAGVARGGTVRVGGGQVGVHVHGL